METILSNIYKSGFGDKITFYHTGSLDSSCKFNDQSLDFVFIDASHKYQETKADILLWIRKIKYNSILAGHDYMSPENPEVRQAVDELLPELSFNVEGTTQGNGVWWFKKTIDLELKKY
jgi:predicted O-methyltransferase YrrM